MTVRFVVTDTAKEMTVAYTGILPDLFKRRQGRRRPGQAGDGRRFTATEVLAKHDENYMPPEAQGRGDAHERAAANKAAAVRPASRHAIKQTYAGDSS
jgi:cytochrome c-type biogenesis protein CcmE